MTTNYQKQYHLFTGSKSNLEPHSKSNLEPESTRFPPCQGQVVLIPLTVIHKYVQEEIQHLYKLLEQCVRFHNAYMNEDQNIDLSSDHYQLHWLHWFCLLWADCRNLLTETRSEWVFFCCISSCWSEGFLQFHPLTIIQLDNINFKLNRRVLDSTKNAPNWINNSIQ